MRFKLRKKVWCALVFLVVMGKISGIIVDKKITPQRTVGHLKISS